MSRSRSQCSFQGGGFTTGPEGVGVFGSGSSKVPRGDWFLCDEDCGWEAAHRVRQGKISNFSGTPRMNVPLIRKNHNKACAGMD